MNVALVSSYLHHFERTAQIELTFVILDFSTA